MRAWNKVDWRRWRQVRKQVLDRDGWRCRKCGRRGRLEVDHIVPQGSGEAFDYAPDHLQTLCRSCHIAKTRRENRARQVAARPEAAAWRELVDELLKPG